MKPRLEPLSIVRVPMLMIAMLIGTPAAWAQSGDVEDDFTVRDENAGYIDVAIPGNQVRMIFDSGFDLNRPSRNEFFYAKKQSGGPGLPLPETSIEYQEATVDLEQLVQEDVSVFVQMGLRALNPDINDNTTGLGDMQLGLKAVLVSSPDMVLTGQLRVSLPTGDSFRGLGTHNTSIEPGLLMFAPLDDKLAVLGELRYWMPVDGTDFAGPVLRYGIGTQYMLYQSESAKIVPIVELVGWTACDGLSAAPSPNPIPIVENADGDTIINLKVGARIGLSENVDFYVGYGHSLTGDRWYRDIARFELRYMF
jgi:hypothetical protein